MKTKDRFLIVLSSYFWALIGVFFTGSFLFFILVGLAFIYLFVGGRKHV
jgi:hypothetical membrane protein